MDKSILTKPSGLLEYHRAQSDFELSKINQMFAVDQSIIDQMLADTVRQVEVDIAIQYCQKHYPDFQLHQPKEQTAVDLETNPDGSKYIIFYPKDGDKSLSYQKYIIKN